MIILLLATFLARPVVSDYNNVTGEYGHNGDKQLSTIPTDIPGAALGVSLSSNAITNVDSFPELLHVKTINLGNNLLTEFPDLKNASASLKTLFLDNNIITQIAEARLSALSALGRLSIPNNKLTSLPDVDMPNLENLLIEGNEEMENFPVVPLLGRRIRYLKLGYPTMKPVTSEALKALPELRALGMEKCGLKEIPPVIGSNPQIETLFLGINNIHKLPGDMFINLSRIVYVDLGYNDLENIPDVCHLRILRLKGNQTTGKNREGYLPVRSRLYTNPGSKYSCIKPSITEIVKDVLLENCAVLCTQTKSCDGWAYANYPGRLGVCGLGSWGRKPISAPIFNVFYYAN
ncbi:hypothetical protein LSH36_1388g00024 [Paralvinella palmiformis]|uniref:Uncharacterized protein n=1 Tax=Paralvinella palmiformis TaxID=53620 RepID=A0AAD9ITB4_9ANNE|nr:hypothetical protein LSH36_1388g00024 [Paralvinella palmiformis]